MIRINPHINVLLTFKEKINYLTITLCTLKEALRKSPNTKIFLYDTGAKQLPDIINDVPATVRKRGPFPNCPAMYNTIIPEVLNEINGEFLAIIEADSVLHPLIFSAMANMIIDLPDMGYGSIFNTPFHPTISTYKSYLRKPSLGFFGSLIRVKLWKDLKANNKVDYAFGSHTINKGFKIYCTKRSYIEHMGFSGMHKREHDFCPIDRAINFWE
jgi:hypothetical protein